MFRATDPLSRVRPSTRHTSAECRLLQTGEHPFRFALSIEVCRGGDRERQGLRGGDPIAHLQGREAEVVLDFRAVVEPGGAFPQEAHRSVVEPALVENPAQRV